MSNFETIAIYTRVSIEDKNIKTNSLKNESNSLANQRDLLLSFIESHHDLSRKSVAEYSDDGFTGRNFERPGFNRMMEAVKAGNINCVITKDCSRFGRDYIEVGYYIEHIFPFLGVRFIAVNDGYDSAKSKGSTPGIDFAFKNLIYDLYSKDLSKKVTSAIQTKMKNGKYVSAFGLYGYKKSIDRSVLLAIDEDSAKIVHFIFELAIEGNSTQNIARILNERKIMTPSVYRKSKGRIDFWHPEGKKPLWSTGAVTRVLRDERYVGNMVYYKRVKNGQGKNTKLNDKEKQIRVENTHEAIIGKAMFQTANDRLRKQSAREGKRKKASIFVCPYCGHRLRESRSKKKYYYCYSGRMNVNDECKNVIIDKYQLEELVLRLIQMQIKQLMNNQKNLEHPNPESDTNKSNKLNQEIKQLEQNNIELYRQFREGDYSKEEFIVKKKRRSLKIDQLKKSVNELKNNHNINIQSGDNFEKAIDRMKPYFELKQYDKNLVAELINKVIVHDHDRLEVEWVFCDEMETAMQSADSI